MQNEPLNGRYADLVPPKDLYNHQTDQQPGDSTLTRLVADLEHLYSSEAPSPLLTERIEAVLQRRADQMNQADGQDIATTLEEQRQGHIWSHIQRTNTPAQTTMLRQQTRVREGSIAMTRKRLSTFAAIAAAVLVVTLMGVLLYSIRAGGTSIGTGSDGSFLARLQRLGGTQVVLDNAPCPSPCPLVKHPLSADIPIVEQRLASKIATDDFQVFLNNSGQLVVEVAGSPLSLHDLLALVETTGELDIINTGSVALTVGTDVTGQTCTTTCASGQYKIVFTGAQLDPNSISAGLDPQTNQPIVTFEFAGAARNAFATYTERNIGNYLTITLDNKVIESATINSQITGAAEISGGNMTVADAQNLATLLKTGALPVPLQVISYSQVKPGTPFPASSCGQPTPTPTPAGPGATPTALPTNIATATPGGQSDGSACQTPTVTPGNPGATPTATSIPPATYTPGPYETPTPPPTPTPTPHP